MSERVIVVQCQLGKFSAISWQELVNFQWGDDVVHIVLDLYTLRWIFIAHWNNSPQVDMSLPEKLYFGQLPNITEKYPLNTILVLKWNQW